MQGISPGKLLLVEDNPADEALMLRAFKKINIKEEVVVRDSAEAVQYLLEQGEMSAAKSYLGSFFWISSCQVWMASRSCNAFNPATRLLPVVTLTTSGQEEDLRRSCVLGASSFVRKPLSYSELVKVASHLVTYWLKINQVPFASPSPVTP